MVISKCIWLKTDTTKIQFGIRLIDMKFYQANEKSIKAITHEYKRLRHLYERLCKEVKYVIEEQLKHSDIKVAAICERAKELESFNEKIKRRKYNKPLEDVTDLAGVRVVCYYESELAIIDKIVRSEFQVLECVDKTGALGVDKMGYHGSHYIVVLGSSYSGARYRDITKLKCEIQVRTVLQDAWALISHHLVYKDEVSIPKRLRRDLNNVASLLEVAQQVFDSIRNKRVQYLTEIREKENRVFEFISQPIDFDTLAAYTEWKYPNMPISEIWQTRLLNDIDRSRYKTLKDLDAVIERARPAVEAYRIENAKWFSFGTDFITKSLGFVDTSFRAKHPWGDKTKIAFDKFGHLVKGQ